MGKSAERENMGVRDPSAEEMPKLLITASFAVNPHFSSSDGLECRMAI